MSKVFCREIRYTFFMRIINSLLSFFSRDRVARMYRTHTRAESVQAETFSFLMSHGAQTLWGKDYGYVRGLSYEDFATQTPLSTYERLFSYIERTLHGEPDVLWPGRTMYFAKSSGTTNDRSKYIPITEDSLRQCHFRGGKDMTLFYLHRYPQAKMILGKTVGIAGNIEDKHPYAQDVLIGDLSAVLVRTLPLWVRHRRIPREEVALLPTWEEKLELLARESLSEDVRGIAGVPSWSQLFIKKALELSGKKSVYDIWPHFEVFFHGGVSLDPYRASFRELLGENFHYEEVYNASEGFFAIQDNPRRAKEMLLMLDYHIFYEFVPLDELTQSRPKAFRIHEVQIGVPYALVITTSGGLWRYLIGDVVEFVSRAPYRIKIVGRTAHSINIFGEELMVGNTDHALKEVCETHDAVVEEYTVAPQLFGGATSGVHEWVIEFARAPQDISAFAHDLDSALRRINSDYDAKRKGDMLLQPLALHSVPAGTFYAFMKSRNRLGGQAKVPRLSEKREYIEKILTVSLCKN